MLCPFCKTGDTSVIDSRPAEDGTAIRRPCLNYQMGRCLAPCAGYPSEMEYNQIVQDVVLFLKGKNNELVKSLEKKMKLL